MFGVLTYRIMKPRLKKILLADWPALFCFIAIPGIWVIGLIFPFLRQGARFGRVEMLTIALPLSLIAAGFLLWRVTRIQTLFRRGAAVRGYITRIRLVRDRGRVALSFGIFLYEWNAEQFGRDEPPPRFSAGCRAEIRQCLLRSTFLSAAVAHVWLLASTINGGIDKWVQTHSSHFLE